MQNDVARLVQCTAEERPGLQFIRVTWHAAVVYHMGPHGHVKTVRVTKPEMKPGDILLFVVCFGAAGQKPFAESGAGISTLVPVVQPRFLFSYYMHVGMCISITAMCISHWYFYRDDPDRNAGTGRAVECPSNSHERRDALCMRALRLGSSKSFGVLRNQK